MPQPLIALASLQGLIVDYFDANGAKLAAIVTAVLDYPAGRVNLTAFNANGTTSAVTGVSYDAQRVPNSWRGREQPN